VSSDHDVPMICHQSGRKTKERSGEWVLFVKSFTECVHIFIYLTVNMTRDVTMSNQGGSFDDDDDDAQLVKLKNVFEDFKLFNVFFNLKFFNVFF
jgi:cell division FtsZ-interacting protein ZapD